ncbi:MAG: ribonuclease P protein component [Deltaproteobacteria bacterium]|nr:ribonuclease P protein component [Deltaproteobacteria bacterium]
MRLRSPTSFTATLRRGRCRSGAFVRCHFSPQGERSALLGIVAARGVGPATVRNRLKRVIRHCFHARRASLAAGAWVVVLLPAARGATRKQLREELTRMFQSARR